MSSQENTLNFLILGSTGFIGKEIISQLHKKHLRYTGISSNNIDLVKVNSIQRLIALINRSTIIIFAAAITREKGDNDQTKKENIQMALNVAKSIEHAAPKKLIFLSSSDVYGTPEQLPISEKTPLSPITPYAISKLESEKILIEKCRKTKVPYLIFRYAGVFGPGQVNVKYGPNAFIKSALDGQPVKIWGDGKELRDFLYVKDLARIIIQLSLSKRTGIFNIATGKTSNFAIIVDKIKNLLPKDIIVASQIRTYPPFDQSFDIAKLKKTINNLSFTNIDKALIETYLSIKEQACK